MPKSDYSFDPRSYATVAERIGLFYEQFPEGRINTELIARDTVEITFKATLFRNPAEPNPSATGWASERIGDGEINTVACLENTETSAIGRALANLGFLASAKRPSREEMEKSERVRRRLSLVSVAETAPQIAAIHEVIQLLGVAARHGFSERRRAAIEGRVNHAPGVGLARMSRLEQRLRTWLRMRGV